MALQYLDGALTLRQLDAGAGDRHAGTVTVDFASARLGRRLRDDPHGQNLCRAVGTRTLARRLAPRPIAVVDATAGLGADGVLLAQAGCAVTLLERSPVVYALLRDGLRRAATCPEWVAMGGRLGLRRVDFLAAALAPASADVVYLDPMYHSSQAPGPRRRGRPRAKKERMLLRALLGHEADAGSQLLDEALRVARQRVVVKRPRRGPTLDRRAASFTIAGSSSRYDVYLAGAV